MKRTMLSVLFGIAVGSAGTVYLGQDDPEAEILPARVLRSAPPERRPSPLTGVETIRRIADGGSTERSAIYRMAVDSDTEDLRAMIGELAPARSTASKRLAMSVLFARYAELDAGAAIGALAGVREPRLAEAMGLAILDVIGTNEVNFEDRKSIFLLWWPSSSRQPGEIPSPRPAFSTASADCPKVASLPSAASSTSGLRKTNWRPAITR